MIAVTGGPDAGGRLTEEEKKIKTNPARLVPQRKRKQRSHQTQGRVSPRKLAVLSSCPGTDEAPNPHGMHVDSRCCPLCCPSLSGMRNSGSPAWLLDLKQRSAGQVQAVIWPL